MNCGVDVPQHCLSRTERQTRGGVTVVVCHTYVCTGIRSFGASRHRGVSAERTAQRAPVGRTRSVT